jgi:hypothetical protein
MRMNAWDLKFETNLKDVEECLSEVVWSAVKEGHIINS